MKQQQGPQSFPSIVSNGDKKDQPVLDSAKFLRMENIHRKRTFCLTTRNTWEGIELRRFNSNDLYVWKECFDSWRNRDLPYCIGFDRIIPGNIFLEEVTKCLDKPRTLEKIVKSTGNKKTYLIQEQVKGRRVRLERQFLPVCRVRLVYRRKLCQLYNLQEEENRVPQK